MFPTLSKTKVAAAKTLKTALTQPPVLTLSHKKGHFTLDTDVCDLQIRYICFKSNIMVSWIPPANGHASPATLCASTRLYRENSLQMSVQVYSYDHTSGAADSRLVPITTHSYRSWFYPTVLADSHVGHFHYPSSTLAMHCASEKLHADHVLSILPTRRSNTILLKDDLLFLAIRTPSGTNTFRHFVVSKSSGKNPHDAMHISPNTLHGTADTPATPPSAGLIRKQAKTHTAEQWQLWWPIYLQTSHWPPLVTRPTIDNRRRTSVIYFSYCF